MLRSAWLAVYSERAVKEVPTAYRERYFRPAGDGYKVTPPITSMVRFRQANLLDENVARETDGQDFLFCRNVLIYFDDASRRRVLDLFYDASAAGWLHLPGPLGIGRPHHLGLSPCAARVDVSLREMTRGKDSRMVPRVLIVDDSAVVRSLHSYILRSAGFATVGADSGFAALEVLYQNPCRLAVIDVNMPRMDGLTLIRQIPAPILPCEISRSSSSRPKRSRRTGARASRPGPTCTSSNRPNRLSW